MVCPNLRGVCDTSPPFIDNSRSGCTRCVILHNIMSTQVLLCLSALPLALSGCIRNGAFPPIDPLPGGVAGRLIRLVPACLPSQWTHRGSCVHVPGFGVLCSHRHLVAEWSFWLPPLQSSYPRSHPPPTPTRYINY